MRLRSKLSNPALGLGAVFTVAISHIAVLTLVKHYAVLSNILQIASAWLALGFCLNYVFRSRDRYLRYMWLQLGAAFALWSTAQCLYFEILVTRQTEPPFPSTASVLYFLVAFPILLVTVVRRTATKWEWVNWLDSAQACIFFFVLDALVFSHPSSIPVTVAYDVQSLALFLTGALRYSTAMPGPEQTFFRNLFVFLSVYGAIVCFGIHLEVDYHVSVCWLDLCWSTPFLLFCSLCSWTELRSSAVRREQRAALPKHLHGLSALGLTVMAIAAEGTLEVHHPVTGAAVLGISFSLFALRTSTREFQLHKAHDRLEHSVLHDALTSLANRTQLHRELKQRLLPGAAHAESVALLFIDLDRFKTINDGLGHAFGDQLLIAVAGVLRSVVRPGDLLARLGGDEFVLLAADVNGSQAQHLANALVACLRQPIHLCGRVLHITASVGVVLGELGAEPDALLRDADCAMYVAKQRGKNQVQLFELLMREKANDELWLETDLRQAIGLDAISVHYQPIYSLTKQAVVGFEALARWKHPTRGMISPAAFIPVAEETGLVLLLGQKVLKQACRQVAQWNAMYCRDYTVSVNVSARQFADEALLNIIRESLDQGALPPDRLKLEITESVLLSGVQSVDRILNAARAMGVEISLDDFGTGYSSLSYLLRFPFDVIKIDRSFVQALDRDEQRAHLTATIVQLANSLGKQVIAEGVETQEEKQCLQAMQCDLLQGYLFSKPLPSDVVEEMLNQHGRVNAGHGDPGHENQIQPMRAVLRPALKPGETTPASLPPSWKIPAQGALFAHN